MNVKYTKTYEDLRKLAVFVLIVLVGEMEKGGTVKQSSQHEA